MIDPTSSPIAGGRSLLVNVLYSFKIKKRHPLGAPKSIDSVRYQRVKYFFSEPMERVVCDQEREEIRIIFHLSVSGDGCL